jgi:hypothetical protein
VPCRKAHDPFPREVRFSLDERPSSGLHESGIRDYGNRRLAYDRLLLHKRGLNSEIRCSGTAPGTDTGMEHGLNESSMQGMNRMAQNESRDT